MDAAHQELLRLNDNTPDQELKKLKVMYRELQSITSPTNNSSDSSDEENQENENRSRPLLPINLIRK